MNRPSSTRPSFDPLIQSEDIAFDPDRLVGCEACERKNPPNRPTCIYCGGTIEVQLAAGIHPEPKSRKLEPWETGYNLILRPGSRRADPENGLISKLLSLDPADLANILSEGGAAPVARLETESDALRLQAKLAETGLDCLIVADASLAAERPPVRLGKIEILADDFVLKDFNTGRSTHIAGEDVVLIVTGVIFRHRVESTEKRQSRGERKLMDGIATVHDETIFDIYSREDATGFRVIPAGFDFSTLGDRKTLLAAHNLRVLIDSVIEKSPNITVIDNYSQMRPALGAVWEVETRNDSRAVQNSGFGGRGYRSIASSSNLVQFTKYSRLQWHIL